MTQPTTIIAITDLEPAGYPAYFNISTASGKVIVTLRANPSDGREGQTVTARFDPSVWLAGMEAWERNT